MRLRRALLALGFVVAALAVATPATLSAQDIGCDPGDVEVERVSFEGNRAFSDAQLANGLVTTPSSWARRVFRIIGTRRCLDPLEARRDSLRLVVFYRLHGFSDVKVSTAIDSARPAAVAVTFRVQEGEPVILQELSITGLDSVPRAERITAGLPVRLGGRFDQYGVEVARDTMLRRLRDNGYPMAIILRSFFSDTAKRVATLRFDVTTGPRARIGATHITITPRPGAEEQISADEVRRVVGIDPGDLYRERDLEAAKRALYLSDAYRHVEVGPDTASLAAEGDSTIDVAIAVAESYMRSVRAGGGWATLDCFRTQADYADFGFLGGLRRLDISARASKIGAGYPTRLSGPLKNLCGQAREDIYSDTLNYYVGATLRQSSLFGIRAIPTVTVYSELRSEYKVFRRYTPIGGIMSLNQQLGRGVGATYAYQLEYGRTTAEPAIFCGVIGVCDVGEQDLLKRAQRLATASITLGRDRRNDAFNPTRGSFTSLELRSANQLIGSDPDLQFNKVVADATWYWSLPRNSVLVARLRGGLVFGQRIELGGDSAVFIPQQERMYAGGANSVRGFRQNELGPVVYIPDTLTVCGAPTGPCITPEVAQDTVYFSSDTTASRDPRILPVGGNSVAVANVELRMPSPFIPDRLQIAFFADAGQVWTRGGAGAERSFGNLRVTPGVGVRVASPVGPIRFDIGYNPYDRDAGVAYFDAPVATRGVEAPLYCVTPGNGLAVTGWRPGIGPSDPQPQQEIPARGCPATFRPKASDSFFQRLTFHLSIGQAF
jgi:outer membrane protein insertion porin family/translocation and assembly module TamA